MLIDLKIKEIWKCTYIYFFFLLMTCIFSLVKFVQQHVVCFLFYVVVFVCT